MIEIDLIKKHGKKILGMNEHHTPGTTFRERLPEILLEIGIIVFAISLSLWLHNWQEHAASRKKESQFLTGLRQDLREDYTELRNDSLAYMRLLAGYRYFRATSARTAHPDSVEKYRWTLYYSTNFYPKTTRFDGLKFSGNLDIIEDEPLQYSIVHYYQELLPGLSRATQGFTDYKNQNTRRFLDEHLRASPNNFLGLLYSDQMRNYLTVEPDVLLILQRYHAMLAQNRQLLVQINQRSPG
jgi:hypothetical protein